MTAASPGSPFLDGGRKKTTWSPGCSCGPSWPTQLRCPLGAANGPVPSWRPNGWHPASWANAHFSAHAPRPLLLKDASTVHVPAGGLPDELTRRAVWKKLGLLTSPSTPPLSRPLWAWALSVPASRVGLSYPTPSVALPQCENGRAPGRAGGSGASSWAGKRLPSLPSIGEEHFTMWLCLAQLLVLV